MHQGRKTILAVLGLGLTWSIAAGASAQDLGSWRPLTAEEEKSRIGDTPAGSIDPAMIEADFDGDGRKDKALIAVRKSNGSRGLIAVLNGRVHVIDPDSIEPSDSLRVAKPGRWNTICGNAFREFHECAGYPGRVTLKNPGILAISDGRTVLYVWDRKAKRFNGVLMVD